MPSPPADPSKEDLTGDNNAVLGETKEGPKAETPQPNSTDFQASKIEVARQLLEALIADAAKKTAKSPRHVAFSEGVNLPVTDGHEHSAEEETSHSKPFEQDDKSEAPENSRKKHRHRRHKSAPKQGESLPPANVAQNASRKDSRPSGKDHSKLANFAGGINRWIDGESTVADGRGHRMWPKDG
ncbi:MAG: hypothetical protein Q9178_006639 [Gyalolechia marmorata]